MDTLITEITNSLNVSVARVNLYARKKDRFYRTVEIPKRRGGTRTVFVPNSEIKLIQNFINEKYLSQIRISNAAKAYKKQTSIKENANPHVHNKHFLLIDIEDFFDNIQIDKMQTLLEKELTLDSENVKFLLKLATHQNKFVQGAVTSPAISNIFMRDFDEKMMDFISEIKDGVYTRYSDDITISSAKYIDKKILDKINSLLTEKGLKINHKKTYFSSYKETLVLTGLKINQGKTTLSRRKKRELNNKIFHKLKYGKKSNETTNHILGYLYFLMDVDPDYFNFINLKYKKDSNDLITRLKSLSK